MHLSRRFYVTYYINFAEKLIVRRAAEKHDKREREKGREKLRAFRAVGMQ